MRYFFSYTEPVMLPAPKIAVKTWPARAVFYALAIAIFSLSLQDDWDLEIAISQASHSFVGKVSKSSRENHGGHGGAALLAASAPWTPSFYSCGVAVADRENHPQAHLLESAAIRAPPAGISI